MGAGVPVTRQAAQDPGNLELRLHLAECNAAAEAYRRDHGAWPGFEKGPALEPEASTAQLLDDLLRPDPPFAAYLSRWPQHPVTGSSHVRVLDGRSPDLQDGVVPAWTWRPSTGCISTDPLAKRPATPTR